MITLVTLSSLNDAFVLRSMLEASEIPAFIPDENTCQMDWGYINAIGGVRVQVPEEFLDSAKSVLGEFNANLKADPGETANVVPSEKTGPDPLDAATEVEEDLDPAKPTSLGSIVLVVLALALIGGVGALAMRAQERKAALIAAIGAYDTGDYNLAIADYSRCIELGVKTRQVYFNRGLSYEERGVKNNATADYDLAIADYGKALEIDPQFAPAYENRGCVYINKGDYDKALLDLSEALRLDSEDETNYVNRAYAYQQKGEYAKAIEDYTQALRLSPNDQHAYANRAIVYDDMGQHDNAIADYNEAVRLDPKDEITYLNRANAYAGRKDFDQAIADYSQVLALDPKDQQTYFNRALSYSDKGEFEKAVADYKEAILINPSYEYAYNNLAWLLATSPQAQFRDGKKAVELALKACELSDWKDDLDTLAVAYAEAGDFANAVKWEEKYLESTDKKASDLADAKKRLALFQNHKPYHEEK